MRIGIDARFYGPGAKGLGRYVEKLLQYLDKIDQENEYIVFLRKENFEKFQPSSPNFKKIIADFRWYSLAEQIKMPLLTKKYNLDLMHFPHFNVPLFYRGKFVVTIHDLILTRFPTERASTLGPALYKFKHLLYKLVIKQAVKKARKIITVSNFSKKDIENNFPFAKGKIEVTYEATSDFKKTQAQINSSDFFKKYEFKPPYILYVGNAYPHKNLERFIKAYKSLIKKQDTPYFVLVGKIDYFFRRLKKYVKEVELSKRVKFLGYVTDEELKFLYQNAKIYVFPSLIEGFGLPPLEAMSQGLPVLSSNRSCLPEVLGEAAQYFDPKNINDMAQKLSNLLNNQKTREVMRQRGYQQVKKYQWPKLARKTLKIYKSSV